MNIIKHFKVITTHKYHVMKSCFRVGLYKQGLLHDLSKYSPTEFFVGAKYFQGNRSPNDMERRDKGYSSAWLHHKGRNKHHFEYWVDYSDKRDGTFAGVRMPEKYIIEMFCDRLAACKTYMKSAYTQASAYEYFAKSNSWVLMHEDTMALLEKFLIMLKDEGEDATFEYIKRNYVKAKKLK